MAQSTPKKGQFYSGLKRNEAGDTFSKKEAGLQLDPPVSEKQVQRYVAFLKSWHPDFTRFKDPETWGLNGEKLTRRDLIELQALRSLFLQLRSQAKIQLIYRELYHADNS
jgi:hypothetical protein